MVMFFDPNNWAIPYYDANKNGVIEKLKELGFIIIRYSDSYCVEVIPPIGWTVKNNRGLVPESGWAYAIRDETVSVAIYDEKHKLRITAQYYYETDNKSDSYSEGSIDIKGP
jgi:hypothetical protein